MARKKTKPVRAAWPLALTVLTQQEADQIDANVVHRNQVVVQYQRLVYKVACRLFKNSPLARRAGSIEALVSSGNMALMDAVRLYDPSHPSKAKFITYACWSIERRMLRDAGHESVVALPEKARLALAGRKAKATYLEEARRASYVRGLPACFDRVYGDEAAKIDDRLPAMERALHDLATPDRKLLAERFGFDGHEPSTYYVMADRRGVTKEAIRQRLLVVFKKLRKQVTSC